MNKIVVITGGTSGIGLELKKLYESTGDTVVTISRRDSDGNHYIADVSNEKQIDKAIEDIGKKYGHIDILINNAGFGISGITELIPDEKWMSVMNVNFNGTIYTTRSAIRYMNKGSKIINISSAMALFPVPYRSYYAAAKSAVLTMSYALRMELAPLGIDVCAICPGDIKTNFTANRLKDDTTNDRYGDRLQKATTKNDSRENKRMSADKCAKKIFKCINKTHTRPMYIIGVKYKILYFFTRITPKSWLLHFTNKMLG